MPTPMKLSMRASSDPSVPHTGRVNDISAFDAAFRPLHAVVYACHLCAGTFERYCTCYPGACYIRGVACWVFEVQSLTDSGSQACHQEVQVTRWPNRFLGCPSCSHVDAKLHTCVHMVRSCERPRPSKKYGEHHGAQVATGLTWLCWCGIIGTQRCATNRHSLSRTHQLGDRLTSWMMNHPIPCIVHTICYSRPRQQWGSDHTSLRCQPTGPSAATHTSQTTVHLTAHQTRFGAV
jgi:hypothetical protein